MGVRRIMDVRTGGKRVVVGVAVLAALTPIAACGGGSEGNAASPMKSAASAESIPPTAASPAATTAAPVAGAGAGKTLSQQDVDRMALSTHDVPGYTTEASTGKGAPVDHGVLTIYRAVTPAACRPVFAAAELGSLHDFSAQVVEDVVSTSDDLAQHASVGLSSYSPADARKVMSELRAALPVCATATMLPSLSQPSAGLGYSDTRSRSVGDLGDEALAFDATQASVESGGPTMPMTVLVVRTGSTVATFISVNPIQPPVIPEDVIQAQMKKLA
jgi:hypothetical protein